jgi:hypothetical protein
MTFSFNFFSDFYNTFTYTQTPDSFILSGLRFKTSANEYIDSSGLSSNALKVVFMSRQVVSLLKQNNLQSSSELINSAGYLLSCLRHNSLDYFLSNSWYLHSLAFHNFYTGNFLQTSTHLINAIHNDIVLYRDYDLSFFIDSHIMLLGRLLCLAPFVKSTPDFQIIFNLLFSLVSTTPFSCSFGDTSTILTHSPSHREAMLLLCRPLNALLLLSSSKLVSFSDLQFVNLHQLLSCFIKNSPSLSISSDLYNRLASYYFVNSTFPIDLHRNLPLTTKFFEDTELLNLLEFSVTSPLALWLPTFFHMTNYLRRDICTLDFPFSMIENFIDSQPDYLFCSFLKPILKTHLLSPQQ